MSLTTQVKIGSSITVNITGKDAQDLIEQASFFGEIPCACGECKSKDLAFKFRKTKDGDSYYELVCRECKCTFAFGQRKDGSGLFPRGDKDTGNWSPPYNSDNTPRQQDRSNDRGNDRGRSNDRRDDRQQQRPAQRNSRSGEVEDDGDVF